MYSEENSAALLDELQPTLEPDPERPRDFFEEAYAAWSEINDYIEHYCLPILDTQGASALLFEYIEQNIESDEDE
jgi:hypothetical protein